MSQSTLPPPRRIVTYHDPSSGECLAMEDTLPIKPALGGALTAATIGVQSDFPGKPEQAPEYTKGTMESFFQTKGVGAFCLGSSPIKRKRLIGLTLECYDSRCGAEPCWHGALYQYIWCVESRLGE